MLTALTNLLTAEPRNLTREEVDQIVDRVAQESKKRGLRAGSISGEDVTGNPSGALHAVAFQLTMVQETIARLIAALERRGDIFVSSPCEDVDATFDPDDYPVR